MDSPWAWFLIGVVIIVAIGTFLYVSDHKSLDVKNDSNITQNVSYFVFYVESNALGTVSYELDNSSTVLMSGLLFPNAVEEYTPMVANASIVNLSIWSDEYYFNVSSCNISMNLSHCRTDVFRKALNYSLSFSEGNLSFSVSSGSVVQSPLICFFWGFNVLNVLVPFPRVPVPDDLKRDVSICYQSPSIFNDSIVPVDIHFRPTVNDSGNVFVCVRDYEVGSHKNIGTKTVGITVQKQ